MRSEDAGLLPQITAALDSLRTSGEAIGVEITQVTMTVHGEPVIYAHDDQASDWNITAQ